MSDEMIFSRSTAGVVLLASFALPILGTIIAFTQGNGIGLQTSFKGVEGFGEKSLALRTVLWFTLPSVALQLVGLGIFSLLLREARTSDLPFLAFTLLLCSLVFLTVQVTFHGTVTVIAGQTWARTGNVPEWYGPLAQWMNTGVQHLFVLLGLLAYAIYGWAILKTGYIADWAGWALIGWGLGWALINLFARDTLPAALFLPPLLIGVTLFTVPS